MSYYDDPRTSACTDRLHLDIEAAAIAIVRSRPRELPTPDGRGRGQKPKKAQSCKTCGIEVWGCKPKNCIGCAERIATGKKKLRDSKRRSRERAKEAA